MRDNDIRAGARTDERGGLLLELVVVTAVVGILSLAIGEMTVALIRFERHEALTAETQRRAATGIESIREAAKGANAVVTNQTVNGQTYVSGTSTVAFALPVVNSGGTILAGNDYIGFRRDAADPTLLLQDIQAAAGSVRRTGTFTIASFVNAFRLGYNTSTPIEASAIKVYLETGETVGSSTARFALSTWVLLENK